MLRILFFGLCFFSVLLAEGKIVLKEVENLNLPSNHIYQILQDSRGDIWLGTNRGIVKFNGYSSTLFTVKEGLPYNDIFRLKIDPKNPNIMWYFSSGKYCGYILNDSIHRLSNPHGDIINPTVFHTTRSNVWIESLNELYLLNKSGFFKYLSLQQRDSLSYEFVRKTGKNVPPEIVSLIPRENTIDLFFATEDTAYYYHTMSQAITKYSVNFKGIKSDDIPVCLGLEKGAIYFISYQNGIAMINLETKQSNFLYFPEKIDRNALKYMHIRNSPIGIQLCLDKQIFVINDELEIISYDTIPGNPGTYSYYIDSQRNLWVSDYQKGILISTMAQQKTQTFLKDLKVNKLSIFNNEIIAKVVDVGYYRFNVLTDHLTEDKNLTSRYLSYGERKMSNGKLLLISTDTTYVLSGDNASAYGINIDGFDVYSLKALCFVDSIGYAINVGDLIKFNPETQIASSSVKAAGATHLEYFNGELFVGGTFGLKTFSNDSLRAISSSNDILETPINCLVKHNNFLLVGTDGRGAYILNENRVFHLINTENFIVKAIIPREKNLWLATDKGIIKLAISPGNPVYSPVVDVFNESDGLKQNNINDICFYNGYLYASSDRGISKINPEDSVYRFPPTLHFTSNSDTLYFNYKREEPVSVSFNISGFNNQKNYTIFFRLDETKKWTFTDNRKLDFYLLSPGLHTLDVAVSDHHNNTSTKRIYLKIIPLWWQTSYTKIVLILLSLLLLFLLVKLIQIKVRSSLNAKLERSKKLYQLKLRALRSQMNPHFVHNSLNSIQYYIQRNEVGQSEKYLEKFSNLVRLFFDYADQQQITIREEIELLKTYFEIEHLRFEEKLAYAIQVDPRIDIDTSIIPTMILQPLAENSINHGIFHKNGNGKVFIKFTYDTPSSYLVMVEDNGIGILHGKKINTHKNHTHNSSGVLKERLELLAFSGLWEIEYTILDLSELGNQTGTQINIKINDNRNKNIIN